MARAARTRAEIEALRAQFAQQDGLPLADLLPAARVEAALAEAGGWRDRTYTPALTLWAFLTQVLSPDRSCRAAVARLAAWLIGRGRRPCSPKTDPYCKARRRLPEALLRGLARDTGGDLHRGAAAGWRWHGRPVKLVDGTTVTMPDTPANQADYPQHGRQAAGVGFPMARVVALFCLATGAALDAAMGRCRGAATGESTLLRGLGGCLAAGDVLVGDRQFAGWLTIAWCRGLGVDVVMRLHQLRPRDFRRGRRLGRADRAVRWPRPRRPRWMSAEEYAALPAELEVRQARIDIRQRGFRSRSLTVVTTLLDPGAYPAQDLGDLYRARWHAELDLRSLKVTLGMDVLRCKSPDMVRKEVWAHLLVYNLIRGVMAAAGGGAVPRGLSFAGAVQAVLAFADALRGASAGSRAAVVAGLMAAVRAHRVGGRPNRTEPRARKRRPKAYPNLTRPRRESRKVRYAKR